MGDNQRKTGSFYEDLACVHIRERGGKILSRNFYAGKLGEIDIVAQDGTYRAFIEVKYRRTTAFGLPEEAVNRKKQERICRVADAYLRKYRLPPDYPVRFDVLTLLPDERGAIVFSWYKDAFPYLAG